MRLEKESLQNPPLLPHLSLQKHLLHPIPTVAQIPTPSLTSSPTAIPFITMTDSPTAMPTQIATPINMAHSGSWVAKGIIPASANYKDLV